MFETIRRQFLAEITGDRDQGRHQVTSLDEVNQLLYSWVRKACHQRVHSETGQGRPRTLTELVLSFPLVVRCRTGLLVGVTARTGAPADGAEVRRYWRGQRWRRATGCWVEDARDGDRGSRRRDGRRGPRLERSPAHSSGWGKSGGWQAAREATQTGGVAPPEADGRSAGSGGGLGCRAYARDSTCSGSLNESPIGSRPHASLGIASLHFLAPRGGIDDHSHGEGTQ
jgi:hypothetical protein